MANIHSTPRLTIISLWEKLWWWCVNTITWQVVNLCVAFFWMMVVAFVATTTTTKKSGIKSGYRHQHQHHHNHQHHRHHYYHQKQIQSMNKAIGFFSLALDKREEPQTILNLYFTLIRIFNGYTRLSRVRFFLSLFPLFSITCHWL